MPNWLIFFCLRFFTNESSSDIPLSIDIDNYTDADFLDTSPNLLNES